MVLMSQSDGRQGLSLEGKLDHTIVYARRLPFGFVNQ